MPLFDTHCHLAWREGTDPAELQLARARAAGVERCLTVATDLPSARECRALAQTHPGVLASAGIHPNDVGRDAAALDEQLRQLEALLAEGGFAAVGETGLDFYRDWTTPELQRRAFRAQLELAHRHQLPVIIHCRQAAEAVLEELRALRRPVRGVMHCYSEGPQPLPQFLDLGLHISFAGNLTYPKAEPIRAAARQVPAERLLLETDAPFLAPQPVRGRKNEPAFLAHTLACLAAERGISRVAAESQVFSNALDFFRARSS